MATDTFKEDIVGLLPHLCAFARSLTSGNVHFADDLVQDTIVNALQAKHQFTPGTNLKAWLFTILRNRFRSLIARKHVTAEVTDDDLERYYWTPPEQDSRDEVVSFKAEFVKLSCVHQEVLVLTGVHGTPYHEMARMMGCEVGTIKSRMHRARGNLKRLLGDETAPPPDGSRRKERGVAPRRQLQAGVSRKRANGHISTSPMTGIQIPDHSPTSVEVQDKGPCRGSSLHYFPVIETKTPWICTTIVRIVPQ